VRGVALLLAAALASGCSQPWPEEGTAAVMLYRERCGGCHVAYRPGLLTAGMWQAMVDRMEVEIRRRGGTLEPTEKAEILAYLQRNAGSR
jgi:hypothetical protein